MDYNALLEATGLGAIKITATIINPHRKDPAYKTGEVLGFKPGVIGGGHSHFKNGVPQSYDSSKRHWKKKPKVLVVYNVFDYLKTQHQDWIDVDNCEFTIAPAGEDQNELWKEANRLYNTKEHTQDGRDLQMKNFTLIRK